MGVGLFLGFCMLLFPSLSLSAQEDSHPPSTCPANFSCGNLGLINFPFTDWSRPSCGLCIVNCEEKPIPIITINSSVMRWFDFISIGNSVIRLHDFLLQSNLDARTCKFFDYGMGLPDSPSISYTVLHNITLFKCKTINSEASQRIADAFSGYKNYDACNHLNFTIYYQNPPYHAPSASFNRIIQSNCMSLNFPAVFRDNYSENIELFQLLTAEFDVGWHVSDDCYECHREGRRCKTAWSDKSRCAFAENGSKRNLVLKVIAGISASGILGAVILCLSIKRNHFFGYTIRFWKKANKHGNIEVFLKNNGSLAPKRYNYSDIKKITNSFKDKLGQGGYGCVYKGVLRDGSLVAVKVLHDSKDNGEEFVNEVASISKTSHVNIVSLLGFCFEGSRRALVYEFMPNGSLEKFIYSKNSSSDAQLGWEIMFKIAVGIARGLEYLHRGCNTKILHFDIKPHNILLNKDFRPKISDFGLAKLCPDTASKISLLGARGTIGYIAPEVFCRPFGEVSHKSDVYSYGMMILEMVGGKKDTDAIVDLTSEFYFPHWIHDHLDSEEIGLCGITNKDEYEKAKKMVIAGLWCIQTFPVKRPSMSRVLEMLEGSMECLEMPPKPFLSSPPRLLAADSSTS